MYHDEVHKIQTRLKDFEAEAGTLLEPCARLMALLGTGPIEYAKVIVLAADEIDRLRAALKKIETYPSLVPSEEHYKQFPDIPRFPDFRQIAREAVKSHEKPAR